MSAHDHELELTALLAVGFLNERETLSVREHLRICSICQTEYRELADVAASIGLSAQIDPTEYQLRLNRVKKRLRKDIADAHARPQDQASRSAQITIFAYQALTALACLVALCAGFYAYSAQQRADIADNTYSVLRSESNDAQQSQIHQKNAVDLLLRRQRRLYALDRGALIVQKNAMYLALILLPSLPPNHAFQAWTFKQGDKKMVPDRVFTPQSEGPTLVELATLPKNIKSVSVTIEPSGGSSQPTTQPIFVQNL
jgi:hypothetical protein